MQIVQQQSDNKSAHELSTTRFTELSDAVGNFRQTEHEHFDMLRNRLDECNGALYQSAERQRVVCSVVALETKSDVKTIDCHLQGVSDTLSKKITQSPRCCMK